MSKEIMNTSKKPDLGKLGIIDERALKNMDRVKRSLQGLFAGDRHALFSHFAHNVTIYEASSLPYGGDYHGKTAACEELTLKMLSYWETVDVDIIEILGGGDYVMLNLMVTFTPYGGEPVPHPIAELWKFDGDQVIESRLFHYDTALIASILAAHPKPAATRL